MVQIPNVAPSTALSTPISFAKPAAGSSFLALADVANAAYKALLPGEVAAAKEKGAKAGFDAGTTPQSATGMQSYSDAIASMETGGQPNEGYTTVTDAGDGKKAYGRYQVLDLNVGPWTKQYYGKYLTPDEFLANKDAQNAVFNGKFGDYIKQSGSASDAAAMWFAGPGYKQNNVPDKFGTTWQKYQAEFNAKTSGGAATGTAVTASDGSTKLHLYSPDAGPIASAYNAAAGISYQAAKMLQGSTDLMDMSHQFQNDPAAYLKAAQTYINQSVASAPAPLQADLRIKLSQTAQQRYLGVLAEHQKNIADTAIANSDALIKYQKTELTNALAAGDTKGAAKIQATLQATMDARKALPHSTWTDAQSALQIQEAHQSALSARNSQASAQVAQWKAGYATMTSALEKGLPVSDISLLDNKAAQAADPIGYQKALTAYNFSQTMTKFIKAPTAQQAAFLAEWEKKGIQPGVAGGVEIAMLDNAKAVHSAAVSAWSTDPVKAAQTYLGPGEMPDLNLAGTPDQIVGSLQARAAKMHELVRAGYTATPVFLSTKEAQTLGRMFDKSIPTDVKLQLAKTLVQGFGADAQTVFDQIPGNEKTALVAASYLAAGGDENTARMAMDGQTAFDTGTVALPKQADRLAAITPQMATQLRDAGVDVSEQSNIMRLATALYGSLAYGKMQSGTAAADLDVAALYQQAVNLALGQQQTGAKLTGGFQRVGRFQTLLPMGVNGEDATAALDKAFHLMMTPATPGPNVNAFTARQKQQTAQPHIIAGLNADIWAQAHVAPNLPPDARSSLPMQGGSPLNAGLFSDGRIRIIPIKGDLYRLVTEGANGAEGNVLDSSGYQYVFSLKKLIAAAQASQ